jgi:hypothetical protein
MSIGTSAAPSIALGREPASLRSGIRFPGRGRLVLQREVTLCNAICNSVAEKSKLLGYLNPATLSAAEDSSPQLPLIQLSHPEAATGPGLLDFLFWNLATQRFRTFASVSILFLPSSPYGFIPVKN